MMPVSGVGEAFQPSAEVDSLFNILMHTAVDGVMVIDGGGTVRFYNQACERLFGFAASEVLGNNVKILMPAPYHAEHDRYLSRYLETGDRHIIGIGREVVGRRKDGSTFPMYLSVGEGRLHDERLFVGIVHDITDRNEREQRIRELQSELLHVSRATAMGQMSSALAHELNQPLTAILSYSNAAARMIGAPALDGEELRDVLSKIAEQTARAGHIIRRLRAFVEKREPNRVSEDINLLIADSVELGFTGMRDNGVKLRLRLDPEVPHVTMDRIEIQQVLVNLVRNAAEAMQESPKRELLVWTRRDGDDHVGVSVADTGPGISAEVSRRLFQPFVTTKPNGMGMGLNICRTIIEAHGGRLWADSNPDGGTVFHIRLPAGQDIDDV